MLAFRVVQFVCTSTLRAANGFLAYNPSLISWPSILGGSMKIKVEYNELEQTENLWGPFIFIKDGNTIRNFEAKW